MEFKEILEKYRISINNYLLDTIANSKKEFDLNSKIEPDIFNCLESFVTKGKLLRGSMSLLAIESFGGKVDNETLKIASSLEMIHSALLIHDDIVDDDELRRGEKTVFSKYKEWGYENKLKSPRDFGVSMAILVGDIAFFIAEELVVSINSKFAKDALVFYTKELKRVGVGQVLDYSAGALDIEISTDEILKIYKNKSARYSFSLPLGVGAIYAGADTKNIRALEELGEKLGMIFQLVDDDLGMFGSYERIGKVVGSDIKENKKTLIRSKLFLKADLDTQEKLNSIFGKKDLENSDIELVRKLIVDLGVRGEINNLIATFTKEARELISALNIEKGYKEIFVDLLEYNLKRTR